MENPVKRKTKPTESVQSTTETLTTEKSSIPSDSAVLEAMESIQGEYDDLNEILVRSKSTISECVNETEHCWKDFQTRLEVEQEWEQKAEREFIEENKRKLLEEENKQRNDQTNERTPI